MAAVQGIALNQLPPSLDAQADASSYEPPSPSVASSGAGPEPEAEPTSPATSLHRYSHELNLANALAFLGVALALVYGGLQVRYMMWTAANDTLQSCLNAISLGSRSHYCDRVVAKGVQAPPLGPRSIPSVRESINFQPSSLASSFDKRAIFRISGASAITLGSIIASILWFRRKSRRPERALVSVIRAENGVKTHRPTWRLIGDGLSRKGIVRLITVSLSKPTSWPLPPGLHHIVNLRHNGNNSSEADVNDLTSDSHSGPPEHLLVFDKSGEALVESSINHEQDNDVRLQFATNLSTTSLDGFDVDPEKDDTESPMGVSPKLSDMLWQPEFKRRVAEEALNHQQRTGRECSSEDTDLFDPTVVPRSSPIDIKHTPRSSYLSQQSRPITPLIGKGSHPSAAWVLKSWDEDDNSWPDWDPDTQDFIPLEIEKDDRRGRRDRRYED